MQLVEAEERFLIDIVQPFQAQQRRDMENDQVDPELIEQFLIEQRSQMIEGFRNSLRQVVHDICDGRAMLHDAPGARQ